MRKSRKQRWVLTTGCVLLFLALVAALPLWLPWITPALSRRWHAHYASYQRLGYNRFRLRELSVEQPGVRFQAGQVEAFTPAAWLWQKQTSPAGHQTILPFVTISNWRLDLLPKSPTATPKPPGLPATGLRSALKLAAELRNWAPLIVLTNGTIHLPGRDIPVRQLELRRGVLQTVIVPESGLELSLLAQPRANELLVDVSSPRLALESHWNAVLSNDWIRVAGELVCLSNHLAGSAVFGSGPVPVTASLRADHFVIPEELLGAGYTNLEGSLAAGWERGTFNLNLEAAAYPGAGSDAPGPLHSQVRLHGDTNSVFVEDAGLVGPGLQAELSRNVRVYFSGPLLRQPAQFAMTLDLGRQRLLPLIGRLRGQAQFQPDWNKMPAVEFQLSGEDLGNTNLNFKQMLVSGQLRWPELRIAEATTTLPDGTYVTIKGQADLAGKTVRSGQVEARAPRSSRWLPKSYSFETASLQGSFEGPFTNLIHEGSLQVTNFRAPQLLPLQLAMAWKGSVRQFSQANLSANTSTNSLQAVFSLGLERRAVSMVLSQLTLANSNGVPDLRLARPARIQFIASKPKWSARVEELAAAAGPGMIELDSDLKWPQSGTAAVAVSRVSSKVFSGFLEQPPPEVLVDELKLRAAWSNSPVSFAATAQLRGFVPQRYLGFLKAPPQGLESTALILVAGGANGLILSNLTVNARTSEVAVAHGTLPLTIHPAESNLFQVGPGLPLQFTAALQPHAFFWPALAEWTGISLEQPDARVQLSGTWEQPLGRIDLRAGKLAFAPRKTRLPELEQLNLALVLDRDWARLTNTHAFIEHQPLSAEAQLPLGNATWAGLRKRKLPNWQQASGRLQMQHAELSAFAPLFPTFISPQGVIDLDARLMPGGKWQGTLNIQHARTRPLTGLGPVRDIEVQMRFQERTLKLQTASARIGGSTVNAAGEADLRDFTWLKRGELPVFGIVVMGTNVPISRQPESIVRSDLNISVVKTNGAPPLISGETQLRNSYFLSDLGSLVPGKSAASPKKRPPYFSVEEPPWADWRLALHVSGDHFLNVRSPVFNGAVSANFGLHGTLKDPIAVGDIKLESGSVRFPFANFQVQQGLVALSSQDPYRPRLNVTAATRQYGYDLRMDVSGPVDAPVIQFSSTPPLSSEQILLMVTAGDIPKTEFSLTPQQKAQTFAVFVGRDLLSRLGFGDSPEQRLTIHSGEELTEQGKPTYNVEYKLSRTWSLTGEYDRFSDFNAGFKWRVFSR
jgi:translocation and assembly module TamB